MVRTAAGENDGSMNDTHPSDAARPRRVQDIADVRRARDDRMVGGVAAGIGRWLNIDPVIVRIGFVALTFVGLAGLILYVTGWLFLPAEDRERSIVGEAVGLGENDATVRTIALIVGAGFAIAAVFGDSAWGMNGWVWWTMWSLLWVAIPVAFVYWFFVGRKKSSDPSAGGYSSAATTPMPTTAPTAATTAVAGGDQRTEATLGTTTPIGPPPDAPGPSMSGPPTPPDRAPWSPALFLATLSVIALTWGGLWLWSQRGGEVSAEIYAAAGLGITAVGLFVGTRFGNAGLLAPVGVILSVVLATTAMLPNVRAGDFRYTPVNAEQATETIDTGAGQVTYDLRDVREPEELAGESVSIRHGVGAVRVIVPRGLEVDIDAAVRVGKVDVFGRTGDGWQQKVVQTSGGRDEQAFDISVTSSLGLIEVVRS